MAVVDVVVVNVLVPSIDGVVFVEQLPLMAVVVVVVAAPSLTSSMSVCVSIDIFAPPMICSQILFDWNFLEIPNNSRKP